LNCCVHISNKEDQVLYPYALRSLARASLADLDAIFAKAEEDPENSQLHNKYLSLLSQLKDAIK
jgi:hemerythrin-like domain-containing protein